jgi:hypothetical protein
MTSLATSGPTRRAVTSRECCPSASGSMIGRRSEFCG